LQLFDTGDLSYGGDGNFEMCATELQEKIDEVKNLFETHFDLKVEPQLIVHSTAG